MVELDGIEPLYQQIADVLTKRISDGTYPLRSRVPSVVAVAEEFKVGKSTAEAAMRLLRERGLTRATHGRGTFVIAKPSDVGRADGQV
ncbi:winged helix-turn-helix domain-containing protein [Actinomadura opuntiae]|uniref:winged helix-turn-helix domain-containing protein n=1 Tax=Actinomadura sp. OS1-43 TaxID=604315 RepID=UPI00255B2B86|nr:winged helix-turn-helix domain-containing protein [Actinomadura sp. OS1-43]MDL4813390.1 winged helix-turn-helix domain-containing protein [Actinomadura sp. OS1-43]